jgi:tungstate transport system substrate-binding protein
MAASSIDLAMPPVRCLNALAMRRRTLPLLLLAVPAAAQPATLTIASTTSTEQSGLFGHILPIFRAATGLAPRVVALGTGQALDVARRGDADVVLVHDRAAEERFVAEGFAAERRDVMHNDFVLIGPAADPARIAGLADSARGFAPHRRRARALRQPGRPQRHPCGGAGLWQAAGVAPQGRWYREVGQGMGPALNTAAAQDAYILSDRGTWLAFRNRQGLRILVEGDARLLNRYGVMAVSPVPPSACER